LKPTLREHWRISTFRLTTLFGVLFTLANVALLGMIYWQTSSYLVHRIDDSIDTMSSYFKDGNPDKILEKVNDALVYDLRKSNIYGLFGPDRKLIAGNIPTFPAGLPIDNQIHQFVHPALPQYHPVNDGPSQEETGLARAIARKLPNGDILVVGRDFTQLAEIKTIILNALMVSGAVIIVLGLAGGFLLSLRPLKRINAIRETSQRIVDGDLSLRMPVSTRNDEVDMLTSIVNLMLAEIERLLIEVKSVTDTIAHDLRTPLTRVRLLLYRAQQQSAPEDAQHRMLNKALTETDALLGRFRALLRISEIENRQKKAGFELVDPHDVLRQIAELFEPLAEDKSVKFTVIANPTRMITADPGLLLEAISNLVDNAIKFTPRGGFVEIRLFQQDGTPCIDIADSGCGIDNHDREAIMQPFYRGQRHQAEEGYGLGLSIVAAITQLHGFSLSFLPVESGTHARLLCMSKPSL
jgi:signal transduction histidine kinase